MKRCARCKQDKATDEFMFDARRPDGRGSYCRPCAAAVMRATYRRNLKHSREKERQRRERDPSRAERWRKANPDRAKEIKLRSSRKAQKLGVALERQRRYHEANPDKIHNQRAKRRARQRQAYIEPISRLLALEIHDGVCGICGGDVDPLDFHIDHVVPLAAGGLHNQENVQPAHAGCNRAKGARVLEAA